jgi:hypothetical protein
MGILIVSAAVLVLTVVLAAYTHEGSWLVYFESLAHVGPAQGGTTDQARGVTHAVSPKVSSKKERIVAVPSTGSNHAKVVH